jgi:hypothetical protein
MLEASMTATIEQRIDAIASSIMKWRANALGPRIQAPVVGIENCPLCDIYYKAKCKGCPVYQYTAKADCKAMPISALTPAIRRMFEVKDEGFYRLVCNQMAETLQLILNHETAKAEPLL